jgi:hypothetical protein
MTDEEQPPLLSERAPGLVWRKRKRKSEWVATWLARTDIINRGYRPRHIELWSGSELTEEQAADIIQRCQHQQFDMLTWGKELPPPEAPLPDHLTGDLESLIHNYRTDKDSPYQKNRYHVRQGRDSLLRRIGALYGAVPLSEIKWRTLLAWHREWSREGKHPSAGLAFIGQIRALFSFGRLLEDPDCVRLCGVMSGMRFNGIAPRGQKVTAEYAEMIRSAARAQFGWGSIALAQAFQFECTLRQKDVIGEWVPLSEPGISDVVRQIDPRFRRRGANKWLRGIRWEEINDKLVLEHITSKKQKKVTIDLKLAPMVIEELQLMVGAQPLLHVDETTKRVTVNRHFLPASGPVIQNDITGLPWDPTEYRRKWRLTARHCGIPDDVWNMDSRSGAISEADMAGAPREWVQQAATHSSSEQTADYTRNQAEATAKVMKLRIEGRNKPKPGGD